MSQFPIAYNEDAERSLLGAVFLRGGEVLDRVQVGSREFYHPRHQRIWHACQSLHGRGVAIDPVTVENELGEEGARAIGGISFLADLVSIVPTADNAEHYAAIVRADALKRELRM